MTVTGKKKSSLKQLSEKPNDQFILVYQNPKKNRVRPKKTLKTKSDTVSFLMNHDHSFDREDDTI